MEPLQPQDPKRLGGWTLTGRLGEGGMGVVYMANKAGKTVALKVISSGDLNNPQVRSRFTQEIQSLSLLRTPYVAPLLEFDIDAKNPWYAVEYISDLSLSDVLKTSGSFTGKTWWLLAQNLLMALAAIHNAEVIHRDLKPGNILITKGTPKLIDFGLAKPIADEVEKHHSTKLNQVMGTPHYMSPEQWRRTKDVDGKTDIWAIGVTLIDAAGGKPWGRKESYEIQALLHNGKLPDLSALDPAQKALVSVMLIPSPEERWSATKILKNFDAFYNYKEAPAAAQVKVEARPIVAPADQRPKRVEQRNIRVEGNRVVVEGDPVINRDEAKIHVDGNRVVVEPDGRLIDKLVGKKYVTSDGVPIFVGSRVKYLKTGQLGVVTKLDKNDTGYVFVRLMGEDEPKIKSTNQLESVGKLGFLNNGSDQPLIKRYGKDILIFWLATPIGWLIYKYFTDKEAFSRFSTSSSTKGLKFWKIGFLVSHGLTLGLLGPFFSIPLAVKQKRALLYVFAAVNLIAVSIFLVGVVNTPNGGTLPTTPTIVMLANYFAGFYYPLVLRLALKKKE
jgi:serine/threonine protein kinase